MTAYLADRSSGVEGGTFSTCGQRGLTSRWDNAGGDAAAGQGSTRALDADAHRHYLGFARRSGIKPGAVDPALLC